MFSRKFTKLPFSVSSTKSTIPFEVIHSDVWGPSPYVSVEGYRYYLTFIDECTRYCWIFPLHYKSQVCSLFIAIHSFVSTQFSTFIKVLQSDGGGEYISHVLQSFLVKHGIIHLKSCPHTPQQNGLAKRKHRHIVETALTLLHQAHLPPKFWFYACAIVVYLINRMLCQTLSMSSPFELLYHKTLSLDSLRVFGCACYPLLKPYNSNKLQVKTIQCIFLGYALGYKGFIYFNPVNSKFIISRHVVFNENNFPYTSFHSTNTSSSPSPESTSVTIPFLLTSVK